jgi:hypothetical protein
VRLIARHHEPVVANDAEVALGAGAAVLVELLHLLELLVAEAEEDLVLSPLGVDEDVGNVLVRVDLEAGAALALQGLAGGSDRQVGLGPSVFRVE